MTRLTSTSRRSARFGFTIVELVLALAIGGVVAVAAHGLLSLAGDTRARLTHPRRTAHAGLTVRASMEGWLRGATLAGGGEPFLGVRGARGTSSDELTFAVSDGGAMYPGRHRVHLWVDRDPSTPRMGLLSELAPLAAGAAAADTLDLAPDAVGLVARYRSRLAPATPWQREWVSTRALPAVVELRLLGGAGRANGGFPPLLALPLRAVLDWEGR